MSEQKSFEKDKWTKVCKILPNFGVFWATKERLDIF